jgi:peptide/nickel transport system substrate-binding protein
VGGEPRTLVPTVGGSPNSASDALFDLVHTSLVVLDDQARPLPGVARELPSIERGTWQVNPDGTMETLWRLRDDAVWHDGQPLTAADVIFGWSVFNDSAVPVASRRVARLIESMESLDTRTVLMRWQSRYAFADQLTGLELTLLPSHLLEATFELRRDQFSGHPYWRNQFVGLGPFKVLRWPSGSSIELSAFPRYFRGAPRIAEVSVRFIQDDSSAMAAVLSGSIDMLLPRRAAQGVVRTVRDRWKGSEDGSLVLLPGHSWVFLAPQFGSPQPEDLADARVRQALAYSLDRPAISEALTGTPGLNADLWVPSTDPRYAAIAQNVARYPFDPPRAVEIFREAGWRREGTDDALVRQGRRFEIEVTTVTSLERAAAVVADYWRDAGIAARETVFTQGGPSERQARAAHSGVEVASGVPSLALIDGRLHSANAPSPENQWAGANRGRYANAEVDDLLDRLWVTLDSTARTGIEQAIARHVSTSLPVIPLLFYPSMAIARASIHNTRPPSMAVAPLGRLSYGWNAHEWEKIPSSSRP